MTKKLSKENLKEISDNIVSDIFYPYTAPYNSFFLSVSELHSIYVEEVGNPEGIPLIFLHGGPGGGITPNIRRYFDPDKWRVILFDQRGAGKSTPHSELRENTTWDLVSDIEKLREKLNIKEWTVFGGSWGSTLALAYAVTHRERVRSLVLRGIFLGRKQEIHWFYQEGASKIYPDIWQDYLAPIPSNEWDDLVRAYYRRLTSDDLEIRRKAANAWALWEIKTARLTTDLEASITPEDEASADAIARIECHYFTNKCFFPYDAWLLEEAQKKLQNIPTTIIHGRYDMICLFQNAYELKKAIPHAELIAVPEAGHSMGELGIARELIKATQKG